MANWEYKVEKCFVPRSGSIDQGDTTLAVVKLNAFGQVGWEAVAAWPDQPATEGSYFYVLLKKGPG
jgi:hypothetical protein